MCQPLFDTAPAEPRNRLTRLLLAGLLGLGLASQSAAAQRKAPRRVAPSPPVATTRGANCLDRLNCSENGHSTTNAYLLSLVSHYMYPHAYNPHTRDDFALFRTRATKRFESWGMDRVDLRELSNIQFGVMSNEKVIIVAFRGSDAVESKDGFEDWIATDFAAAQQKVGLWGSVKDGNQLKNPAVHVGFYNAYSKVRSSVNGLIAKHGGSEKTLFITGHSLGGALAVFCAIDQGYALDRPADRRFRAQGVYTYGAPRVGNGLFARLYRSKLSAGGAKHINTQRYVNGRDGAPMYPGDSIAHNTKYVSPVLYGFGEPSENVKYTHVGRLCQILRDEHEVQRDVPEFRGVPSIHDHHSKRYANRIFLSTIQAQSWGASLPLPPKYPAGEPPV